MQGSIQLLSFVWWWRKPEALGRSKHLYGVERWKESTDSPPASTDGLSTSRDTDINNLDCSDS